MADGVGAVFVFDKYENGLTGLVYDTDYLLYLSGEELALGDIASIDEATGTITLAAVPNEGDIVEISVNDGFAEAAVAFDKAIAKADIGALAIRRYNAKSRAGQVDAALTELQGWVDRKNDRTARHLLSSAYLQTNRLDDARRESEKLLEKEPTNPILLNNLAWIYQQQKDSRAKSYAERALKAFFALP